jgi:hypothetical protein
MARACFVLVNPKLKLPRRLRLTTGFPEHTQRASREPASVAGAVNRALGRYRCVYVCVYAASDITTSRYCLPGEEMHSVYTDDKHYLLLDLPVIHVTCTVLPCHQQPKQCKHPR